MRLRRPRQLHGRLPRRLLPAHRRRPAFRRRRKRGTRNRPRLPPAAISPPMCPAGLMTPDRAQTAQVLVADLGATTRMRAHHIARARRSTRRRRIHRLLLAIHRLHRQSRVRLRLNRPRRVRSQLHLRYRAIRRLHRLHLRGLRDISVQRSRSRPFPAAPTS